MLDILFYVLRISVMLIAWIVGIMVIDVANTQFATWTIEDMILCAIGTTIMLFGAWLLFIEIFIIGQRS